MFRSILTQLRVMLNKRGFQVSFSAVMVICLGEVILNCYGFKGMRGWDDGFVGNDPSSAITTFEAFILCQSSNLLDLLELLFPFLCLLPFSFSLLTDKTTNTDVLFCAYEGKRRYVISKIIAVFVGSFIIFMIPLCIEILVNYIIFDNSMGANIFDPNWRFTGWGVGRVTDYPGAPFGDILAMSPLLFSLLYAFFFSVMGGVFGVFGLACSVFCRKNKALAFAGGFVIFNILQFLEDYSMNGDVEQKYTALDPFRYTTFYYFSGYIVLDYALFFGFLAAILAISCIILFISSKLEMI